MPRVLASGLQRTMPAITPAWLRPDGTLDTVVLLQSFLAFWRLHGKALLGAAPYHEIAPHLVLMAFLHRVANGQGTIEREYAVGRDRLDLCLRYKGTTLGIEVKVWRDQRVDPLAAGLEQHDGYLAKLGVRSGWLMIFDRREGQVPLAERTETLAARTQGGREVTVVRA
jgi:hypothetical protein